MASSDINRHYHFTLDEKADSFLGIMIEQLENGDAKLSQPKLLKQILSKYPRTRKLAKKATHPYGPATDDTPLGEDHSGASTVGVVAILVHLRTIPLMLVEEVEML
jgi:hypothetical protein